MTQPGNDAALAPARRGRARQASSTTEASVSSDYDDAEVARGQAAAVLGALARMQLRLDVLARAQSDSLERVIGLLEEVNARLRHEEGGYSDAAPALPLAPPIEDAADLGVHQQQQAFRPS